jgi:hypothetical protein
MGTTSDIDHFVMDSLIASFDGGPVEAKSKALAHVQKDLEKIRERFEKSIGEIAAIEHLSELFDQYGIYTSVDRLELLRKILKEMPEYQAHDATLSAYIQSTIPKRNILAHVRVRVEANGFSRKLVDRKNVEHTSANMKALRLELLGHHEAFEALSQNLKAQK